MLAILAMLTVPLMIAGPCYPGGIEWSLEMLQIHNQIPIQWTPDGSTLIFRSLKDLHSVRADGSDLRKLTKSKGSYSPEISPDGKKIVYMEFHEPAITPSLRKGSTGWSIITMNLDGSKRKKLTRGAENDINPTWSPDASQIAFVTRRGTEWDLLNYYSHNLFLINQNGTGMREINLPMGVTGHKPAWSPDGERIAIIGRAGREASSRVPTIYTVRTDGTGLTRIGESDEPAIWSEDGSQITFTKSFLEDGKTIQEVYRTDTNGHNPRMIARIDPRDGKDKQQSETEKTQRAMGTIPPKPRYYQMKDQYKTVLEHSTWSPDKSRAAHLKISRHGAELYTTDTDWSNGRFLIRDTPEGIKSEAEWYQKDRIAQECARIEDPNTEMPQQSEIPAGLLQDCQTLIELDGALQHIARIFWARGNIFQWPGAGTNSNPEIPAGQTRVTQISLRNYNLTGELTARIARLTELIIITLNDNQLTGPIPTELGQLEKLIVLRLDNNQLTGPIPTELGKLENMRSLRLDNNQLAGPIPPELGWSKDLQELNLENNQLTGPVPPELGQLKNLKYLGLRGNKLTGCIPDILDRKQDLKITSDSLEPCNDSPEYLEDQETPRGKK